MRKETLKDRMGKGLILLDGAMGTELLAQSSDSGKCNDLLNIDSPDIVLGVHKSYLAAGSDVIITNTFGANRYALSRHKIDNLAEQINTAGAQIARQAAGDTGYVLGDIGPSGDFLEPLGSLKPQDLKRAFCEQAEALLAGGVDGFIIETMTALDEIRIAIEAVKSVSDLPALASMAFDKAGDEFRTMMGVDVESAASAMISTGVDVAGFNCGTLSLEEYVELAGKFVSTIKANEQTRFTIFAEPNAGKPELIDGQAVYKVTPGDFAAAAEEIHSAGVNIIGGCCGTTPAHIEAVAKTLKK
ncbi:MAG: homocysteine S-methyltransferase family protein [Sedimentisphaerales bacterium]|nr:homocysteine S-methyltransferase family protein [Sedimentisphaerales bacterium]